MFRRTRLDDVTIERLLSDHHVDGEEMLMSFLGDTRLATSIPAPRPSVVLAAFLAEDLSTENGDLLVTAASNVPGPALQAAGLPKRRKNMIELALSKLAALGLAAKIGVATGALALTGTAAAATGALPEPVTDAIERTGIEIPGGKSADHRKDVDRRQDAEHRGDDDTVEVTETEDAKPEETETPAKADFGTGVSNDARNGAPQEDGRAFGTGVSETARDTHKPETTPTAESNPGTPAREVADTQRPASTRTADSNPGTARRP